MNDIQKMQTCQVKICIYKTDLLGVYLNLSVYCGIQD